MVPSPEVSVKFRLKIILFFGFLFLIFYGATNRYPIFEPKLLPLTPIDDFFGFHPWTVWIYISDYFLMFAPPFFIKKREVAGRLIKAVVMNFVLHFPIFFLIPTTMIRPPLPTLPIEQNLTNAVFHFIRLIDTPVNCFPSQHVSLCFVMATVFLNYKKKIGVLFLVWAALISLSTMTTKQHYMWDVLGGLAVAFIIYVFVFRRGGQSELTLADRGHLKK